MGQGGPRPLWPPLKSATDVSHEDEGRDELALIMLSMITRLYEKIGGFSTASLVF